VGFLVGLLAGILAGLRFRRAGDGGDLRRDLLDAAPDDIAAKPDLQQKPGLVRQPKSQQAKGVGDDQPEKAEHGDRPPVALQPGCTARLSGDKPCLRGQTFAFQRQRQTNRLVLQTGGLGAAGGALVLRGVNLVNHAVDRGEKADKLDVSAAAGGGRAGDDIPCDDTAIAFPPTLLRRITAAPTSGLRLITISGDSMTPTLEDGDMVMIDTGRTSPSPPGIFVLDDGVGLVAKRVDAVPNSFPQQLRLSSDNPAYSNYQRRIDEVRILGRVVWFTRSL